MRLTGRLWKLRAWSTAERLPSEIVEAMFPKKMNINASSGPLPIFGMSRRKNSRIASVRRCRRGHGRKVVREIPTSRMPRCIAAPSSAPTAGAKIPIGVDEQQRPDDDAEVVEQRRHPVEEEPPLGDQDLAERHRSGEQDLREAHDPEQVDVERAGRASKPGATHSTVNGATTNSTTDTRPMTRTASHEDRSPEVVGRGLAVVTLEAGEDGDERRRQPARHDDAEQQLRDQEGGLERIELVGEPERLAQDPLADETRAT